MQQIHDPLHVLLGQLETRERSISYKIHAMKSTIGAALQANITEGKMNINEAQEIAAYLIDNFTDALDEQKFNFYIAEMKKKFPEIIDMFEEK